jgi:hypothetical protein
VVLTGLIGFLALFSLLSIVVGTEDPRQQAYDPKYKTDLWMPFGIR